MTTLAWLVAATLIAPARPAPPPEPCARGPGGLVSVDYAEGGAEARAAEALVEHLAAEFASRGVSVCRERSSEALAQVTVRSAGGDAATIVVEDRRTGRASARALDLAAIPPTGRPLAVAIAAAELLTAVWLASPPSQATPTGPAPRSPDAAVAAPRPAPARSAGLGGAPGWALEGAFVGQAFGGDHLHLGPEVRGDARALGAGLRPYGRVGLYWALPSRSPNGSVDAVAAAAGLGVGRPFDLSGGRLRGRLRGRLDVGLDLIRVDARGAPRAGARAFAGIGWAVAATSGASLSFRLTPGVAASFGLDGGLVTKGVRLTDDGRTVSALSGWTVRTALGLRLGD